MIRTVLSITLLLIATLPGSGWSQTGDRAPETQYFDAAAKEKAVRAAFTDSLGAAAVLKAVRTVVAEYEEFVERYPTNAYCDDALWNAAALSLDAFKKYGDEHERAAASRLLHVLVTNYPTSKFAPKAPQVAAAAEKAVAKPAAARPARIATLSAINRVALPEAVRVTIRLDSEVTFHQERLTNPDRLYVDLYSTRLAPDLRDMTLRFEEDALPVRQVRIGRHPENTIRVVLDSIGVSSCSVYALYGPYRLVIECIPEAQSEASFALPPRPTIHEAVMPTVLEATPLGDVTRGWVPPAGAAPAIGVARQAAMDALAVPMLLDAKPFDPKWGLAPVHPVPVRPDATAAATPPPPANPPVPAASNVGGGFSVARQLGMTVSRIVIDPGHGGHDPGAKGAGVVESELVLDIALRLEKLLRATPGIEVILTRRTDEFVPLEERTAIANRENADLFLSIHANGSRNTKAGGVETYFLNFATNQDAAAVAARENAGSGQPMSTLPEVVKAIALNNKLDESRDFATMVQRELLTQLRPAKRDLKDLGVKQAPFVVLIGAGMPSVLTEVSFLTNPQEARLLKSASYRQRIAQALSVALKRYQTSLRSPAVALQ